MNIVSMRSLLRTLCVLSACALHAAEPDQARLNEELIDQVRLRNIKNVQELLDKGANPDAANEVSSALQYAAGANHSQIMRLLIDRGADVNAMMPHGRAPVTEAAGNNTTDALKLLLSAGAQPIDAALAHACWLNREENVTLLLKAGVSPDAGLPSAAQGGHVKLLKRLLSQRANVNAESPNRNSALHLGALQGSVGVVRLLLQHGADPNATNENGETPLHMAVQGDSLIENVRLLLDAKADPRIRNKELVSPIRLAAIQDNVPAYKLLLEVCGGTEPIGITPKDAQPYKTAKPTRQLIQDLSSKDRQTRKQAKLALVTRGGPIMPELLKALESPRQNGQLYEVLWKIGPEAEAALPLMAKLLTDKHNVVAARLTMDRIKPGHFAQLPAAVRKQAGTALYEASIDPKLREGAGFFAGWLSKEWRLKLLRSQKAEHRALAVNIRTAPGQRSAEAEAELIRILLSKDERISTRKKAARVLGRSDELSKEAKSALLKILKASPPYASDIPPKEREEQQKLRGLSKEAGRALGTAGPSIIDDLLPLLAPMENHLRPGALKALIRLGSDGVPRLIELLSHEDEAIRISASVALNRIGKPAVPALIRALDSKNEQVVEGALSALWWIGQGAKDAIPSIQTIVVSKTHSDDIIIAACRTALKIDSQNSQLRADVLELLPTLMKPYEGQDLLLQIWATEVLSKLGPGAEPALPALRKYLERRDIMNNRKYFIARTEVNRLINEIERELSPK